VKSKDFISLIDWTVASFIFDTKLLASNIMSGLFCNPKNLSYF